MAMSISTRKHRARRRGRTAEGFAVVEVLVGIAILAIAALSLAYSMVTSIRLTRRAERQSVASQLAFRKLEEMAAVSPITLSSANNLSESSLVVNAMTYSRSTTVTVNVDGSRTATVVVTPANTSLGTAVTLTSTFALWGTN
jgi:type II secretory pathway pseudopilin PulG